NVDLAAVGGVHDLKDVDFCGVPGGVGVAANGAGWGRQGSSAHRAAWVLAPDTALVLSRSAIVRNMHHAYERVEIGGPGLALCISGPSKTADIEQALVIGAQGPRSCTVLVIEE